MIYRTKAEASFQPRRGTSVTELAFVLPVVLVFVLGAIDFAQVMFAYGTVSEAARAGARYAIAHGAAASLPSGPTANDANVEAVVKYYAFGLGSSNVAVASTWTLGSNAIGSPVNVTATYNCKLSIGRLVGLSNFSVKGSSTMMVTH
jgi:Flp pilus assembly protein TadG